MTKFKRLVTAMVVVLVAVGLLIIGSGSHQARNTKPIRVAASLNFYGEAARQVAGQYGQVTTFINNAAVDPHDYQPGTKEARQVSAANVVIVNGLGYDDWLSKIAMADDKEGALINVAASVAHKKAGANEHVWYRPQTMVDLTSKLAHRYSRIDPSHRQYYFRRAHLYQRHLQLISREINACQRRVNHHDNRVDVTEPVFDYALASLGYRVNNPHFAKAVEDGNDPSPKDIRQMQADIIHHRIAFLVVNTQETDGTIDNMVKLAQKHRVPLMKVTEAEPAHQDYVQWMTKQYRELAKIQQSKEELSSH